MKEKMSRWGVGPVFAVLSITYGIVVLAISRYFEPLFQFPLIPEGVLRILGIVLIVIGIPFFIISVITVMKAYNADGLVTSGVYSCCRHPLYGAWVVFIVPGIVFIANSWLGLTAPVLMYFLLKRLVISEENYLQSVFGTEYVAYQKRVPTVLPYGRLKKWREE